MSLETVYIVIALIIAVVLHELAHGAVARWLGDETAAQAGRLTLNPLKHVDRMGTIILPLLMAVGQILSIGRVEFLYGWAKPVPVDPLSLRWGGQAHPRQLMALVAVAGPLMNFALALLGGLALWAGQAPLFLLYFILINLTLGLFNLLPLPPMDGGRIAVGLLPLPLARALAGAEKYGIAAVFLLLFVAPTVAGQMGMRFDPYNEVMGRVLPWAMDGILQITGHGVGYGGAN